MTYGVGGVGDDSNIGSVLGLASGGVGAAGGGVRGVGIGSVGGSDGSVGGVGGRDGSAAGVVAGSGGVVAAVKGIPRSSRGSSLVKAPLHGIHRRPAADLASGDFNWYGFGYAV